jgi:hypothetical protein
MSTCCIFIYKNECLLFFVNDPTWVFSVFKLILRWFPSSKLLLKASHEDFLI